MDTIQTITDNEQLIANIDNLTKIEPKFIDIMNLVDMPTLQHQGSGFTALLKSIVEQQLSLAAAKSIYNNLVQNELTTADAIKKVDDDILRKQGVSKQKIRYIRSLIEHDIDYAGLEKQKDKDVIDILTAVTGIGNWTAEMYLLFSLRRQDILAADDLAIKLAVAHLYRLSDRPTVKHTKQLTQTWSPYRSTASLLLWKYYRYLKANDELII